MLRHVTKHKVITDCINMIVYTSMLFISNFTEESKKY